MSSTQAAIPTLGRLPVADHAIDERERDWWGRFAEVEERYCWVQTPAIQRFLRGRYIRRIASLVPPNGRILDLGCGCGWIAILLAKLGGVRVVGIDFSKEQIDRALANAEQAGVADAVEFIVGSTDELAERGDRFDVVLMHAFLHHLSTEEVSAALRSARSVIADDGRLILFEPVSGSDPMLDAARRLSERIDRLTWPARDGRMRRRLKMNREESNLRKLIGQRQAPDTAPRGPSPKEIAFHAAELPALMEPMFEVESRDRCMVKSHLVAQEYLLMGLSHPWIAAMLMWPALVLARRWDRKLARITPSAGHWLFELIVASPKRTGA